MRYFVRFAYLGTAYHGWQIQPGDITVQEVLDGALSMILRTDIHTTGAGRTDTGVHARCMVAHFDVTEEIKDLGNVPYRLNRVLPKDISVDSVFRVSDNVSARFDAVSRTYRYYIVSKKDPFNVGLAAYMHYDLDIEEMNKAASLLFDYEDFTSFSKVATQTKTNNCKVTEARWYQDGDRLVFEITANRFLRNMVRAIVGTLIQVGRHKMSVSDFISVIEKKNRCSAADSAPAQGLYLEDIVYPEYVFIKNEFS